MALTTHIIKIIYQWKSPLTGWLPGQLVNIIIYIAPTHKEIHVDKQFPIGHIVRAYEGHSRPNFYIFRIEFEDINWVY